MVDANGRDPHEQNDRVSKQKSEHKSEQKKRNVPKRKVSKSVTV